MRFDCFFLACHTTCKCNCAGGVAKRHQYGILLVFCCCFFQYKTHPVYCVHVQTTPVEVRGGTRRRSARRRKRPSSPSALAHLTAAACFVNMATSTPTPPHTPTQARHDLGRTSMQRDRILQQASTDAEEWKKNKLLIARINKRISQLQVDLSRPTTARDVSIFPGSACTHAGACTHTQYACCKYVCVVCRCTCFSCPKSLLSAHGLCPLRLYYTATFTHTRGARG